MQASFWCLKQFKAPSVRAGLFAKTVLRGLPFDQRLGYIKDFGFIFKQIQPIFFVIFPILRSIIMELSDFQAIVLAGPF